MRHCCNTSDVPEIVTNWLLSPLQTQNQVFEQLTNKIFEYDNILKTSTHTHLNSHSSHW